MAPERPLGKHEHAVFRHLKDATTPLEDLDRRLGIRLSDLGRQTGGPWFVVSNDAIADRDVHGFRMKGSAAVNLTGLPRTKSKSKTFTPYLVLGTCS